MGASSYSDIKDSLRNLYLGDPRPCLVGLDRGIRNPSVLSLLRITRALGKSISSITEAIGK